MHKTSSYKITMTMTTKLHMTTNFDQQKIKGWKQLLQICEILDLKERMNYTWSPSEGTAPEPRRRSKALTVTPPELGISQKSAIGNLEEEKEGGGGSEKIKAEKVVEIIDRDNGLLVILANMLLMLHGYFVLEGVELTRIAFPETQHSIIIIFFFFFNFNFLSCADKMDP